MPTNVKTPKDPNDIDDWVWRWDDRLETGETISSRTVTATGGTVDSSSIVGETVIVRLSGGTAGTPISARCRIVTSTGRQLNWTYIIPVGAQ